MSLTGDDLPIRPRSGPILYVEDDESIREAIGLALEDAGLPVQIAASAEEGMAFLEREPVSLIVTDYNLPGESGVWLLDEARRRRLYAGPGVIVTAHWNLPPLDDYEVLHKPVDLDVLLGRVAALIGDLVPPAPVVAPVKVQLALHVSHSLASRRAQANLAKLLEHFDPATYELRVLDLARALATAELAADHVAYTPTLVKRFPEPKSWLIGDLSRTDSVVEWLDGAGLGRKVIALPARRH